MPAPFGPTRQARLTPVRSTSVLRWLRKLVHWIRVIITLAPPPIRLDAVAATAPGGVVRFDGHDITHAPIHKRALSGLQRSYQITSLFPQFSAEDNVALAIQAQQGHSFQFWAPARLDDTLRAPARLALRRVGLEDKADLKVSELAHGEQRQLELGLALAAGPAMLLLDEPMAGMGQSEGLRMMEILRPLKGQVTMLLVEHDMDVVFSLADTVSVLVKGSVLVTGTPDQVRDHPEVRRAYLGDG